MDDSNTLKKEWEKMRSKTELCEKETRKDLHQIENKFDQLTKRVQQECDQSLQAASQEINRFLTKSGAKLEESRRSVQGQAQQTANEINKLVSKSGERLQETSKDMVGRAGDTAHQHPWWVGLAALIVGVTLGMVLSPERWMRD